MNARTKTFNFPFRGTENHQAYVSINVRKTLDTTQSHRLFENCKGLLLGRLNRIDVLVIDDWVMGSERNPFRKNAYSTRISGIRLEGAFARGRQPTDSVQPLTGQ